MTVELEGPLRGLHGGLGAVSVMEAARFAYRLLLHKFWTALALLWLPLALASISLYVCLMGYFGGLLHYLANPDPKVASLALGFLAAGVVVPLFFWSMAVAAITNLALGEELPRTWYYLRGRLQEWRLYAGYLRFLLLFAILGAGLGVFFALLASVLPASRIPAPVLTFGIIAVLFWFTARVGFLMPPIVAITSGTILRAAWYKSEGHGWRIASLMVILLVPAIVVFGLGEIVLDMESAGALARSGNMVADYARFAERGLATFLFISTIASFLTITLLTAGATSLYQQISQR